MKKNYKSKIKWTKKQLVKCNKFLTWNTIQVSEYISHWTTDWLEGGTGHYILRLDRETIQIFSLQRNDIIFAMEYDEKTHIPELYIEYWDEELKTYLNLELKITKHPTGVQTIIININEN